MAEGKSAAPKRATAAQKAEEAPLEEQPQVESAPQEDAPEPGQYPAERLISEAEDFAGYSPAVVAGALHADGRDTLSRDELSVAIEKWLQESPEA